jgi:hypothetical protein
VLLCAFLVGCAAPLPSSTPTTAATPVATRQPTATPSLPAAASPSASTIGSPSPVGGGCGTTQVRSGPGPDADLGLTDNPWASATPADAGIVAYFWYPPPDLIVAHGPITRAKVLWISHGQQAAHLTIVARPLTGSSIVVRLAFPPSASGGYPSLIDLPSPGCWQLEITLGTAHATLDVTVAPVGSP